MTKSFNPADMPSDEAINQAAKKFLSGSMSPENQVKLIEYLEKTRDILWIIEIKQLCRAQKISMEKNPGINRLREILGFPS